MADLLLPALTRFLRLPLLTGKQKNELNKNLVSACKFIQNVLPQILLKCGEIDFLFLRAPVCILINTKAVQSIRYFGKHRQLDM